MAHDDLRSMGLYNYFVRIKTLFSSSEKFLSIGNNINNMKEKYFVYKIRKQKQMDICFYEFFKDKCMNGHR